MNRLARKKLTASSKTLLVIVFAVVAQLAPPLICAALRIINLDSPRTALQGDTIQLGCVYSLTAAPTASARFERETTNKTGPMVLRENATRDVGLPANLKSIVQLASGQNDDANDQRSRRRAAIQRRQSASAEMLYAIKWYKDEREFYRYIAQDWPHKQTLPFDGLHVDIEKSDNQTVVLRNVSLKTSGLFKCEVSTDAPYFVTKSIERKMLVYSLPDGGPQIERTPVRRQPQQTRHAIGDQLEIVCRSRESKPAAQIDWIINDSLNLSSVTPLDVIGRPIFQVTNKQFVRLPISQSVAPSGSDSQTNSTSSDLALRRSFAPPRQASPVIIQRQSWTLASRYTTFELLNNQTDRTLTVRPADSSSGAAVSLASISLDQLLETSLSTLNFSVDVNLLQLLSSLPRATKSQQVATAHKKANAQGIGTQNSKWRKSSAGAGGLKTLNLTGYNHVDHLRLFNLQIKCLARVLHLSASDEIKLKLGDSSGVNSQQQAATTFSGYNEAQVQKQQRQMVDKDSGAISLLQQSTLTTGNLIFFLSSVLITYLITL